jgi:hypothetical protein
MLAVVGSFCLVYMLAIDRSWGRFCPHSAFVAKRLPPPATRLTVAEATRLTHMVLLVVLPTSPLDRPDNNQR